MDRHLLLTVHLHDRFHGMVEGSSEWPPSPGRIFQAIVAGAARGRHLQEETRDALEWLESLQPPAIAAPVARLGRRVVLYVPNNDADSLSDPTDVSGIRVRKPVHPRIPGPGPIYYAWRVEADPHDHAAQIVEAANDVYQLGRGVDMAWASGEILSDDALSERLARFEGVVLRPGAGVRGPLACPARGTLRSLIARVTAPRFTVEGTGRNAKRHFANPPKPFFVRVAYQPQMRRLLFDLRRIDIPHRAVAGRPSDVVHLVERIRDEAVARLTAAMPDLEPAITGCLVGKKPGATGVVGPEHRVRIVPLLSIGFEHADRGVRRVMVDVPAGAPLRADDVAWAFTGLEVIDADTGEIRMVLVPSEDSGMLRKHYLPRARRWRSVTPLALPEGAGRRRVEPTRRSQQAKGGAERVGEEGAAGHAVTAALRHAGIQARATWVRLQREPFEAKGLRAEAFERHPRFAKERLWHAEVEFITPVEGPLVIGDGRFLGLGLMAPVKDAVPSVHAFAVVDGLISEPEPLEIARALRRAVMARAQGTLAKGERLSPFFSGHAGDGTPLQRSQASHLSFAFDPDSRRLLILAPHIVERRAATEHELAYLRNLDVALEGFRELRAGHAGLLLLAPAAWSEGEDSILGRSQRWSTITPYVVTRHAKGEAALEAVRLDVLAECRRAGLPVPRVECRSIRGVPNVGVTATLLLSFEVAVTGPISLGRTRHLGGGLFQQGTEHAATL